MVVDMSNTGDNGHKGRYLRYNCLGFGSNGLSRAYVLVWSLERLQMGHIKASVSA